MTNHLYNSFGHIYMLLMLSRTIMFTKMLTNGFVHIMELNSVLCILSIKMLCVYIYIYVCVYRYEFVNIT